MLYELNKSFNGYKKVKKTTLHDIGCTEKQLENLVSANIRDFIYTNDLFTIFTERQFQEEPDIIALDKNGDMYIFELKRWSSSQENLLQVLRYGQKFGQYNYDKLSELYRKKYYSDDNNYNFLQLKIDHSEYFNIDKEHELREIDFNKKQNFILLVNGLDVDTINAIIYWKNNGIRIEAIIYFVYDIDNRYYIEFSPYSKYKEIYIYDEHNYIINTNDRHDKFATDDMLKNKKVACYYPGWRENIEYLNKGDNIFLYKNGSGIVGYGIATGNLEKKEYDGFDDYEYYMKLDKFIDISDNPLSASDIKNILGKNYVFMRTMFSITDDEKDILIEELKKHQK